MLQRKESVIGQQSSIRMTIDGENAALVSWLSRKYSRFIEDSWRAQSKSTMLDKVQLRPTAALLAASR